MGLPWKKIVEAAGALGVAPCFIWAVASNESAMKAFDATGQVLIRFEKHVFQRELRRRGLAEEMGPKIAMLQGVRREALHGAMAIHQEAALRATSFGMFQIMGFNHEAAGFESVMGFVNAQNEGPERQLESFCAFVRHEGLVPLMRKNDFKGFARRYNGPAYAANRYDSRLEQAYDRCLQKRG